MFDLSAYLRRIGYEGSRTPSLATLHAVHELHARALPFEAIDSWLGEPVAIDLPAVVAKLVHAGRGGYCYEHNTLLAAALTALGFRVSYLGARVVWNQAPGFIGPRNHMILRVDLAEGTFIADAGFGGNTLTAPLALVPDVPQTTPHERFRLARAGDVLIEEVEIAGQWRPIYRFDLEPQLPADYEMGNWYMSTHPRSRFVVNLVAGRPLPGRRLALNNRQLAVHHSDGRTERRTLESPAEIRRVLVEEFAIRLPPHAALDARLAGLP